MEINFFFFEKKKIYRREKKKTSVSNELFLPNKTSFHAQIWIQHSL